MGHDEDITHVGEEGEQYGLFLPQLVAGEHGCPEDVGEYVHVWKIGCFYTERLKYLRSIGLGEVYAWQNV
jgi:hypothetical protein